MRPLRFFRSSLPNVLRPLLTALLNHLVVAKPSSGKSGFLPLMTATSTHEKSLACFKLSFNFGLRVAVYTYPFSCASYVVFVHQYQHLQSCFLHCLVHTKPACSLLRFGLLSRAKRTFTSLKFRAHTNNLASKI